MKFTFKLNQLRNSLDRVSGVVENSQVMPVLGNFMFGRNGGLVTVLASAIDREVKSVVGEAAGDDFRFTANAKKLMAIVKGLAGSGDVEVDFVYEDKKLLIKQGKSRFSLQTLPAEDFPLVAIPQSSQVSFQIPQNELKGMIDRVSFACAASTEQRVFLTGVYFVVSPEGVYMAASNGHHLSRINKAIDVGMQESVKSILPSKTVLELSKLLNSKSEGLVNVEVFQNQIRFTFGDAGEQTVFVSKVIESVYPDIERIIKNRGPHSITVNRKALMDSISMSMLLNQDKMNGVVFEVAGTELTLESKNPLEEESELSIEISSGAVPARVSLNGLYLRECLSSMPVDEVCFHYGASDQGVQISDTGDKASEGFVYMCMPMRI